MPYQEELAYLYSLQKFGIKLGLANIKSLCAILDNPQDRMKTIHVGGTNGKGSTAAIISAILCEAGYKVGLYTSPHLTDFTERIRINNIPVSEERIARLISEIRGRIRDEDIFPTFFEFTTALAFLYFAEEGVDIAVVEVGMGGRLDATNIVNPIVSVITNVEYDHTEHLGPSLEDIAVEKCGTIKGCAPVVTSEKKPHIISIIENRAGEAGTVVYLNGRDFRIDPLQLTLDYSRFCYYGLMWKGLLLESRLTGMHQLFNIGIAIHTIELLNAAGIEVAESRVIAGVRHASWPGRLETLSHGPMVLLDGAHNHAAVIALREFMEHVLEREMGFRKLILVFGVLKDKDASSMLGELISFASEIIITRPATERGFEVEELEKIIERLGVKPHELQAHKGTRKFLSPWGERVRVRGTFRVKPHVAGTVPEALSMAYDLASSSDIVLVTGSLYVVGEARAHISGCSPVRPSDKNHLPVKIRG